MSDVMLDLETMGVKKNAAMLSVACVQFDLDERTIDRAGLFYQRIHPDSYEKYENKFSVNISTITWWMEQEPSVREEAWGGKTPLEDVLLSFDQWVKTNIKDPRNLRVWAHGKDFDPPILEHALKVLGMEVPWRFYNTMDTRTAYFLAEDRVRPEFPVDGYAKHHPVGDCISQINALFKTV